MEDLTRHRILILEGPAGSGKTTLGLQLAEGLGVPLIRSSLKSRNPDRLEAARDSAVNDYGKIVSALCHPQAIVDRCLVSQWVYGALRSGRELCDPREVVRNLASLVCQAKKELDWRRGMDRKDQEIRIILFLQILLPSPSILQCLRSREAGRLYPWSPQEEIGLYRRFFLAVASPQIILDGNIRVFFWCCSKEEGWSIEST